jgi:drug/metabolite transporter (DMT)-like permease
MPEYLSLLRELSVNSIYALFILVIILALLKGRIRNREFIFVFYVWLPIAVVTQFLMTYFRIYLSKSNLPIMNIYLMVEFTLFVIILLEIKKNIMGKKINYKLWIFIIVSGLAVHFIDKLDTIHSA